MGNTTTFPPPHVPQPVHPHACGEHISFAITISIAVGSSPRMWGTLYSLQYHSLSHRFIPTHVGNTSSSCLFFSLSSVHPHACGEHIIYLKPICQRNGSSPRMWGTQDLMCREFVTGRFIPTHVGNTAARERPQFRAPVHPHACGEHLLQDKLLLLVLGSSPRMWGTLRQPGHKPLSSRFIPTHVGNTSTVSLIVLFSTVHPHACGEHAVFDSSLHSVFGSSPRMWGTPFFLASLTATNRFIPTHVGNTFSASFFTFTLSVHPHACGEHDSISATVILSPGSSPRMWGTHKALAATMATLRFIPTHVGNTVCFTLSRSFTSVHPHACGEHLVITTQ